MKSIRIVEYTGNRAAGDYQHEGRRFPWPQRFWHGAWLTESGHIIRVWVDDVHMDTVRQARRAEA